MKRSGQTDILVDLTGRKWKWIALMARKDEGHLTREAFGWETVGKRKRGRPRQTWMRATNKESKEALKIGV